MVEAAKNDVQKHLCNVEEPEGRREPYGNELPYENDDIILEEIPEEVKQ